MNGREEENVPADGNEECAYWDRVYESFEVDDGYVPSEDWDD